MPSFLYDSFRLVQGGNGTPIDLHDSTFSMFFVDELDDTPDQTNDTFVNPSRAVAAQVPAFASAPALGNPQWTVVANRGVFDDDGSNLTFTALTGDQSESVDLFEDTGTDTTSRLIANFDDYTGLPLTPSGSDVVIVFHANGIFRI